MAVKLGDAIRKVMDGVSKVVEVDDTRIMGVFVGPGRSREVKVWYSKTTQERLLHRAMLLGLLAGTATELLEGGDYAGAKLCRDLRIRVSNVQNEALKVRPIKEV